jgi:hypothetical protein
MSQRSLLPRRPEDVGPSPGAEGWLAQGDDELLFRIAALPPDHDHEADLLAILRSPRHFFVRQEAAKKVRDRDQLKAFAGDRHIGQVLVRQMTRASDATYLEMILRESRHLEVRNAASAQLRLLRDERAREGLPGGISDPRRGP